MFRFRFLPSLLILLAFAVQAEVPRFTPVGSPFHAHVTALAPAPSDPAVIYAGTEHGGVFKSVDGGLRWSRVSRGLPLVGSLVVHDLAVDPNDPDVVLAAVLETADGRREPVYKTSDGGANWAASSAGLPGTWSGSVVFDPAAPGVAYAFLDGSFKVFESRDAGDSWEPLPEGPRSVFPDSPLAVVPVEDGPSWIFTVFAGVVRSVDGGASWQQISPAFSNRRRGESLLIDPENPDVIYAGGFFASLLVSKDGGETWREVEVTRATARLRGEITALAFDPVAVGPAGDRRVLAAVFDDGLYESLDGGDTWSRLPNREFVARRVVDLSPLGEGELLAGSEGGIWRLRDGIWREANRGLVAARVRVLEVDRSTSPPTLYAGLDGGGIHRSGDRGRSWSALGTGLASGLSRRFVRDLAIVPRSDSRAPALYAAVDSGRFATSRVARSFDGGTSWQSAELGIVDNDVNALGVDPTAAERIWAATEQGLFRSVDSGVAWTQIELSDTEGNRVRRFRDILVMPTGESSPPLILVTAFSNALLSHLWRSDDGGTTWQISASPRLADPRQLAWEPRQPDVIWMGSSGGLFRSLDGGLSWRGFSSFPGSLENLLPDPSVGTNVHGAGEDEIAGGPWRSTDYGAHWSRISDGLLDLQAPALAVDPTTDPPTLFAGTLGGGVFASRPDPRQTFLDLLGGEYRVEIDWRDAAGAAGEGQVPRIGDAARGAGPPGIVVPLVSDDSAVLSFFTPGNWEMLVKVLDGRSVNGNFWVFLAAATDVGYEVRVTDTACGSTKLYSHLPGTAAPALTDTAALADCATPGPPSCVPGEETLCLGEEGRFRVEVEWRNTLGMIGNARRVDLARPGLTRSDDSTLFYFFSPENWEVLVKVLDGCATNGHVWVFAAATTDVGYTLKVTETATGQEKKWTNPLGNAADAITDTAAFRCRP